MSKPRKLTHLTAAVAAALIPGGRVTGQIIRPKRIPRNAPCPCGCGKKAKHCIQSTGSGRATIIQPARPADRQARLDVQTESGADNG